MNRPNKAETGGSKAERVKKSRHHAACNYFFNGTKPCNCHNGKAIAGMTIEQTIEVLKH